MKEGILKIPLVKVLYWLYLKLKNCEKILFTWIFSSKYPFIKAKILLGLSYLVKAISKVPLNIKISLISNKIKYGNWWIWYILITYF